MQIKGVLANEADNTVQDLHNSSCHIQPHPIVVNWPLLL